MNKAQQYRETAISEISNRTIAPITRATLTSYRMSLSFYLFTVISESYNWNSVLNNFIIN